MLTNEAKKSWHQLAVETFMLRMKSAEQNVPVKPEIPSLAVRRLRASLMLEECIETIRLGLGIDVFACRPQGPVLLDDSIKFDFKEADHKPSLIQIADGLADQRVVNDGTGSACGIALAPIHRIVMPNNLSKFGPGHSYNELGKLVKPKDFVGPDAEIKAELLAQGAKLEDL